jgi:hypothetical protein
VSDREVKTARYSGKCRACRKRHISEGDQIISYGTGWAELDCAVNRYKRCPICGAEGRMDANGFFRKWLPARQHASDDSVKAIVTASFPFEFRCRESWGVKMSVRFTFSPDEAPDDLRTMADVLSGQRFGPFQCFCEADELVEEWFETRTWGDDPGLANLPPHIREIVTGVTGDES